MSFWQRQLQNAGGVLKERSSNLNLQHYENFYDLPPEKNRTPLLLHDSFLGKEVNTFKSCFKESLHTDATSTSLAVLAATLPSNLAR